jgi:hypothetical protein
MNLAYYGYREIMKECCGTAFHGTVITKGILLKKEILSDRPI